MKKKCLQKLSVVLVFALFGVMALGSGSTNSSDSVKSVTTDTENVSGTDDESAAASEISIDEQVLLDQDGLKITATGMENDSIWGEGIKLLIENNTDKNLGVGCNALIVNDYMISDLFASSIAAGKKANEVMYMSSTELEAAGISNIGKVEIYFHIYDDESYDTIFDSDCITIQTSDFDSMDTESSESSEGQELYNQDGIRILGEYVDENSFWGTAVLLYVENTSGKNVGISCDNMSINGYMVTPYFSSTVYDGKKSLDDITIMSTDLEDNNITSVDDIEVNFHIYDNDTYDTIADTGAISFSAK